MTPNKDFNDKRKIKKLKIEEYNKRYAGKAERKYWGIDGLGNEKIESLQKQEYISILSFVPKLLIAIVCVAIEAVLTNNHNELFVKYHGSMILSSISVIFTIYAVYPLVVSGMRLDKEMNEFEESQKVKPVKGKNAKNVEQVRELADLMRAADPIVLETFLRSEDQKFKKA